MVVGIALGVTLGIGGTLVVDRVSSDAGRALTARDLERLSLKTLGARARTVECRQQQRRPFYTCEAYVSASVSVSYQVTVAPNGRCFTARPPVSEPLSPREQLEQKLDQALVEGRIASVTREGLVCHYRGSLSPAKDCGG